MNTKKIFLSIIVLCLLPIIFLPATVAADSTDNGLVPCNPSWDNNGTCTEICTICIFFQLLYNIYDFMVFKIAGPVAVIALTIGGILVLVSGGNPNLQGTGKKIVYSAVIGLALVFCSWLIINTVLTILGYKNISSWWSLNLNCTSST